MFASFVFSGLFTFMLAFAFYYPLFMAYLWMIGAVRYYWQFERKFVKMKEAPPLPYYPGVSIVVPMKDEGDNARDTIHHLLRQKYSNFDIIAINDGSTDNTGAILDELCDKHLRLRVVHLATNQGKAVALNTAALISRNEFLVCIDGDALLDDHAVGWYMRHFVNGPRVGAVTGNPRVRNRSTLLGKLQVGEFSSIIGLIKRSQRTYGRVFTVSGVVSAFRKAALHDVGYWSPEMLTEDIDISWKMQLAHWDIRYEPKALCWILMPETLRGLWKQRLRWAMGGVQALRKYLPAMLSWRKRRMWMICLEFMSSVLWAYSMAILMALWILGQIFKLPELIRVPSVVPGWNGAIIGVTCLIQIGVSFLLDARYEAEYSKKRGGLFRTYYWMIWYPIAYWMLNMLTTVWALPKAFMRKKNARAVWVSPDRGINPS